MTIILSVSLVLAFLICMAMVLLTLWRRRKKRLREQNDEELRLRKRSGDEMSEREKEARIKQKFWVKSTARWKASIRSSARRRRNRRLQAAKASAIQDDDPPDTPITHSARTSLASDRPTPEMTYPPSPQPTSSPPAYIQGAAPPPHPHSHTPTSKLPSPIPINHAPAEANPFSSPHDVPHHHPDYTASGSGPYESTPLHYHLATDDKALLARMAALASAPHDAGGEEMRVQTSAPAWRDDDELELELGALEGPEEAGARSSPSSSSSSTGTHSASRTPPSLFPPPGRLAAPAFYAYEFEMDAGPSAPPFEEHGPSAPPVDEASAPPMEEGEPSPSAPDWDWDLQEDGDGQDHDRHPRSASATVLPMYHA